MSLFRFVVTAEEAAAGGAPAPPETFEFELYPSGAESIAIDRRVDEVSGGLNATVDLDLAIRQMTAAMRRDAAEAVWPRQDIPPADEQTEEAREAFRVAWNNHPNGPKLARLMDMQARLQILAEWPVLGRNLPPAWTDIAALRISPTLRDVVLFRYATARGEAAEAQGKPQASGS